MASLAESTQPAHQCGEELPESSSYSVKLTAWFAGSPCAAGVPQTASDRHLRASLSYVVQHCPIGRSAVVRSGLGLHWYQSHRLVLQNSSRRLKCDHACCSSCSQVRPAARHTSARSRGTE